MADTVADETLDLARAIRITPPDRKDRTGVTHPLWVSRRMSLITPQGMGIVLRPTINSPDPLEATTSAEQIATEKTAVKTPPTKPTAVASTIIRLWMVS